VTKIAINYCVSFRKYLAISAYCFLYVICLDHHTHQAILPSESRLEADGAVLQGILLASMKTPTGPAWVNYTHDVAKELGYACETDVDEYGGLIQIANAKTQLIPFTAKDVSTKQQTA